MRLPLTDEQRELLRRVREEQLAMWRDGCPQVVDAMFVTDEVVRLVSGMGRACYLGLDGRVWVGNLAEGESPSALEDPKAVASCIVRWSGCIGLRELVKALPPATNGGTVCPLCQGSREMWPGWGDDLGNGFRHYCQRCWGLGWVE